MRAVELKVGFIPLVDAAPLIVAHEMGFAGEEGVGLDLVRAPSWSSLRDQLVFGGVQAAHMLAPVPVAMALGLGGVPLSAPLSAVSVLSVNGTVVGVSRALGRRMRERGFGFGFDDALAAGQALVSALDGRVRVGVPFPFSMHAELLYYWLSASGLPAPQGIEIRTVPPPLMADAMAAGEIDAFCVGEPWGSIAVENGVGELLLPGSAIWRRAPEKVLAVRNDWAQAEPDLLARLMRAVWRAGRWLGEAGNRTTLSEILSRPDYLGVPAEMSDRALTGRMVISPDGETRDAPGLIAFFQGAATFPWKSQAAWIGYQLASRTGLDRADAVARAQAVFRTDLYRQNLADVGAEMPGASAKLEGALSEMSEVASASGRLILMPDRFFDGQIFDPDGLN